MPLQQYAYFALTSTRTSAREMTAELGLEPDETRVRGSRFTDPVIPVCHSWKVVCREPGLRVDEQIAHVLDRLRPHTDRIAALARKLDREGPDPSAALHVVRCFNDVEDTDEACGPEGPNLFGWHLGRDVLDFLAATGAVVDVDEYDMSPDAPEGDARTPATPRR
ncbi:DUF4279 domain-containing protein [Streptomyces griseocarneus]|uniref:DUF4279 domain-containing protein n=1 Tax=Streptomyces griseocarneus TaxID=51201 RepID=UPI00167EC2A2|nr:DUF4279 domain-containing protein [Streptomyces griseocarneus]MBZ6477191.1 DUF4279 domain-containing protein [Streptomyces griseocarneus]GHG53989.1 hypothetical protein GCM10018779_16530 [Streptomyces griseocarneus]